MPDSSDDFFNSFDSPGSRRPPPPPPNRRGAPPPPPPVYGRPSQPQSNYVLHSGQPPVPPPPQPAQQSSYYTPPAPAPSMYAHQPPPQQQQQQPPAPTMGGNDWYSPPAGAPPAAPMMQPMMPNTTAMPSYSNYGMEGTMDTSNRSHGSGGPPPQTFVPRAPGALEEDEPPLLEELGINIEHILMKTKAVVIPFRRFQKQSALMDPSMIVEDADLAGPLAFALLLGGELMMTGKLQFGYIYGFGLFGCLAMTLILNLMSPKLAVSFWTVTSILGYALLPVNVLAALKIVLLGYFTEVLAIITVLWSTTASTRLLEIGCGMADQRFLLAYPIALLYSAFVLITIF